MKKDLKQLVSMGMTLPQGALGIVQALEDIGGTFEDFTSLIGDKFQCDEIARGILRRHIIHVDRTIRPTYPDYADKGWINNPEFMALEGMGPAEFDARKLIPWLHDDQKEGYTTGKIIYAYQKSNNMLGGGLGLHDLIEIQKKGVAFYQEHFKGLMIFALKSAVRRADGYWGVPCLIVPNGGEVELRWPWLGQDFGFRHSAPRF